MDNIDKLIEGFRKAGAIPARRQFKPLTLEGWICSNAAEVMKGKTFAFTAVVNEQGMGLGLAVANEAGYNPIPRWWVNGEHYDDLADHADALNEHVLDLDKRTALTIIASTMHRTARRVGTLTNQGRPS